jgi:CubicO group peptidase (beta-lactamase class C family)
MKVRHGIRSSILILALAMLFPAFPCHAHPGGIDPAVFAIIDQECQATVDAGNTPGVALLIGRCPENGPDEVLYQKVYGYRVGMETLTLDTLYDLASVTKPTFTASAIMFLLQDGLISDEDFVSEYIPGFEQQSKGDVKIKHLLTHTSGLPAYTSTSGLPARPNPDALIGKIAGLAKTYTTGEGYVYSCLNFITLARIVENVSGETVTAFLKRRLWDPIGMIDSTHFPSTEQLARTAPTLAAATRPRGRVHDPLAWYYTDYDLQTHACGNAGGFSTVLDEARLCRLILRDGTLYGKPLWTPETVSLLTDRQTSVAGRSYGWGVSTSWYGKSANVISHSGYTGTYLYIDLTSRTYCVIFMNYVYPDDNADKKSAAGTARGNVFQAIMQNLDDYNGVPDEAFVIDNDSGAPGYQDAGGWQTGTSAGYKGQASGYRTVSAGSADARAEYRFTLQEGGLYRIHQWHLQGDNRTTGARYVIAHREGESEPIVTQRTTGSQWTALGLFEFDAGERTIFLDAARSTANGYVIADALMVEPIALDSEILVDDSAPAFSASAGFGTSSSSPARFGSGYRYLNPGIEGEAVWTLSLPSGGAWELFEWHNGNSTRSAGAPFRIVHADGTSNVSINQQQNSGSWVSLGTYAFSQGEARVSVSGAADGIVIADAVKARKVTAEVLVDDLDARFECTNGFFASSASPLRNDATYRACRTGEGQEATWNLHLPYAGSWTLYEMHNGTNTTRATAAPFRIEHGGGTETIHVNQQENSGEWTLLGTYPFNQGSGKVVLSNAADSDYVIADAIRAVYLGPETSSVQFELYLFVLWPRKWSAESDAPIENPIFCSVKEL